MTTNERALTGLAGPLRADETRAERDARDKTIESLQARAALAGFILHLIDDGDRSSAFLICRWNLSRTLDDVAAVEAFLNRVGRPMHDAVERFREAVHSTLGNAPEHIEPGRLHRFSTSGKRSDSSGWCKVFDDLCGGVFGDFRAGISETWAATGREQMAPAERAAMQRQIWRAKAEREAAQREAWRKAGDNMRYLWRQCRPVVAGDAVHRYLRRRLMLDAVNVPQCIRFHAAMPYVHDGALVGTWPAMVAPIVGSDGQPRALHRTYLTEQGGKANVPGAVRKLTPVCGLLTGASIRLHEPRAGVLGVAEGIETALAASCASSVQTIAAYSAGGVARFLWPVGVGRLVIFADHDEAGVKASAELRIRAERAGVAVNVMTPSDPGSDWCDVWAARAAVEVTA